MATILIAEDDPVLRTAWTGMLASDGHVAFCCPDGRSAFDALTTEGNWFDMLLTDVIMPRMDGRELTRTIRTHDRLADIPIVIASSVVGPSEIFSLLQNGATYYLQKPIQASDLSEIVQRCIQSKWHLRSPHANLSGPVRQMT